MKSLETHRARLRRLFNGLVRTSLGLTASCGGAHRPAVDPRYDPENYEGLCTSGVSAPRYFEAGAEHSADLLALFALSTSVECQPVLLDSIVDRTCETEPPRPECALDPEPNIWSYCAEQDVLLVLETRGDVRTVLAVGDDVPGWVGEPDSDRDVTLLARTKIELDCDSGIRQTEAGWDVLGTVGEMDSISYYNTYAAVATVDRAGHVTVTRGPKRSTDNAVDAGRRPAGLVPGPVRRDVSVGVHLARAAHFEAASVPAFLELARDLVVHGAPAGLVADCHRAARDEVRHAAAMTRLALEHGVRVTAPTVWPSRPMTLLELGVHNAMEGCARETWAALIASHQALAARDPAIRATMATIAADETRHAALAWAVAEWLEPRLTTAERSVVDVARRTALDALAAGTDGPDAPTLGLPSAERRATLFAGFRAAIEAFSARKGPSRTC